MILKCKCGISIPMEPDEFPLQCVCGRRYSEVGVESSNVKTSYGPGFFLKKSIRDWFGAEAVQNCGCENIARTMDSRGPEWCLKNIEAIVDHMQAEAEEREWFVSRFKKFSRWSAKRMVKIAVRRSIKMEKLEAQSDVVLVLNRPLDSAWWSSRALLPRKVLRDAGITCATIQMGSDASVISNAIRDHSPKIVIVRAFIVTPDRTRKVAERFPNIKFIAVNHSSQSHLLTSPSWSRLQREFAQLAEELPNCFYATVDERNFPHRLSGHDRHIWIPNCVGNDFDVSQPKMLHRDKPVLSLMCRNDAQKNLGNQIIAAGLVNKVRPVKLVTVTRNGDGSSLTHTAALSGVEVVSKPWMDMQKLATFLRSDVDVGLQVSFTESFNYVAIEHLQAGVPVVSSDAVRFNPWQARADDPQHIADAILEILGDYRASSELALTRANALREFQNSNFINTIRGLLDDDVRLLEQQVAAHGNLPANS